MWKCIYFLKAYLVMWCELYCPYGLRLEIKEHGGKFLHWTRDPSHRRADGSLAASGLAIARWLLARKLVVPLGCCSQGGTRRWGAASLSFTHDSPAPFEQTRHPQSLFLAAGEFPPTYPTACSSSLFLC